MEAKRVGSATRRRLVWAASAAGLIGVTAVVASSVAGATPFFPQTPGVTPPNASGGTADLKGVGEFPLLYAAEGSSGDCLPGHSSCQPKAHVFTLTKGIDSSTPALAQAAVIDETYPSMSITIHSHAGPIITYELTQVGVVDDHQVFERISASSSAGTVKELITLRYNTIRWKVGTKTTGYDWASRSKL